MKKSYKFVFVQLEKTHKILLKIKPYVCSQIPHAFSAR